MKLLRALCTVLVFWGATLAPFEAPAQILLLGVGRPSPSGPPPAGVTLVGLTIRQITTGSETFTPNCGSGCAAGDLVITYAVNNGTVTASLTSSATAISALPGGSNTDASSFNNIIASAVMGATDAAVPLVTLSGGVTDYLFVVAIYRGATTVTVKDFQNVGGATTSLPYASFTPSGSSKGVLIFTQNLSNSNITSVSNGTWTARTNPTSITGGFFNFYLFDQLSGYTAGTSTQSNLGTSTKSGYEVELSS